MSLKNLATAILDDWRDAEEAYATERSENGNLSDEGYHEEFVAVNAKYESVLAEIDRLDAEEKKKRTGEWIVRANHLICPFCGESVTTYRNMRIYETRKAAFNDYKFCPRCGEKVNGK